ncbi:hypothetical protein D3C84_1261460 [compost metagenome]
MDWHDDGQRCQPELAERQAFFEDCRAWLEGAGQTLEVIEGDWETRRWQVLQRVARWLR